MNGVGQQPLPGRETPARWEVDRDFGLGLGGLDRGCTNDDCRYRFERFVDSPCE